MSETSEISHSGTTALGVDDAVGFSSDEKRRVWYVAVINRNSEKLIREKLLQKGYEAYVASQLDGSDLHTSNRRRTSRSGISALY